MTKQNGSFSTNRK